jgi:hypothetical protein
MCGPTYHPFRLNRSARHLLFVALPGVMMVAGAVVVAFLAENREGYRKQGCDFVEEHVDVGVICAGDPVTHTFHFTNRVSEPMKMLRVQSDCGCITHRVESKVYAPGESGEISVDIDTSRLRGPSDFKKRLLVECSAGNTREMHTLVIGGTVGLDLHLSAETVALARSPNGDQWKDSFLVRRGTLAERDFRTLNVTADDGDICARLKWINGDECKVEVSALRNYGSALGRNVRLSYQRNGETAALTLPVMCNGTEGQVQVRPAAYFAFANDSLTPAVVAQQTRKRMRLLHSGELPLKIIGVRAAEAPYVGTEVDSVVPNEFFVWLEHLPNMKESGDLEIDVLYCLGQGREVYSIKLPCYLCVD